MVLVFYKFYWVESGVHRLSCHGIAWAQCEDKRRNKGPWDLRKKECRQWGHWRWAQDWSNPCVSLPVAGGEWPDHSLPIPCSLVTSQPLGPTPDPHWSVSPRNGGLGLPVSRAQQAVQMMTQVCKCSPANFCDPLQAMQISWNTFEDLISVCLGGSHLWDQ